MPCGKKKKRYTNKQIRFFAHKASKGGKVPSDWRSQARGRKLGKRKRKS